MTARDFLDRLMWVLASMVLWSSGEALAQDCESLARSCKSKSRTARELFNCALDVAQERCYEAAIEIWLDVVKKVDAKDAPEVNKALGLAFKKLERLPEAWHHLSMYVKAKEAENKPDEKAEAWLRDVEKKLGDTNYVKIALSCGATLKGVLLSSSSFTKGQTYHCPLTWWFKPGKHVIEGTMPDGEKRTEKIVVSKLGDKGLRELAFKGRENPPGPSVEQPGAVKRSRALEWALIWSGVALGAAGGVFGLLAYTENEDLHSQYLNKAIYPDPKEAERLYRDEYDERVAPKLTWSYLGYGLGGAAIASGLALWLLRPDSLAEGPSITIVPMLGRTTPGAMLDWEF